MPYAQSDKARDILERVRVFLKKEYYPLEDELLAHARGADRWQPHTAMEGLKARARKEGLWNLFLNEGGYGEGLSNLDYAPICEELGRSPFAPEVFNCNAPDTGNMEVLAKYGSGSQKEKWLKPLLEGEIRSAFAMTEPDVASSDARNIETSITREGDSYRIKGTKWWTSGAGDPRCKILVVMGKTGPEAEAYRQHAMILVPLKTKGVTVRRMLNVFGYEDAPHGHGEIEFDNVSVPEENIILGEGRGFEIAQGRLGPGRIHHCMRLVGLAERALELMCARAGGRVAFGQPLSDHGVTRERIAGARIRIDQARLLTLNAAALMDRHGNKAARKEIGMIKVAAPAMACKVLDWAIQLYGGGGVSDDFPLAYAWAQARALRLADGPDEVHRDQIARLELKQQAAREKG